MSQNSIELHLLGKLPPQALDLEEAVLGAILLESHSILPVISILKPECFYKKANEVTFAAIVNLFNRSHKIDILTVTEELRRMGRLEDVGGAYYVTELTCRIASAAHTEDHARIIYQKFIQRELIRISAETMRAAFEDTTDGFDLLQATEVTLMRMSSNPYVRVNHISIPVQENINRIEHMSTQSEPVVGIPTGWTGLDRIILGLTDGDLHIVAGRPGMGKSAIMLSMALNAATDFQKKVAFFSLEMSGSQLALRAQSMLSAIPSDRLQRVCNGSLTDGDMRALQSASHRLSETHLYLDETPALSIVDFRGRAARMKIEYGIQVIYVDYLQLMRGEREKNGNREQEISSIARGLKLVAKELNIPIVAGAQLSRAVETRGGEKKPALSDLRESGSLEQDSDKVILLYRPEYYGIKEDDSHNSTEGMAEIIVAKHRNGNTGSVWLRFKKELTLFMDDEPRRQFQTQGDDNPF